MFVVTRKFLRMSREEKLVAKLRSSTSDQNWTLTEVVLLLNFYGFKKVGGKGSHQVFISENFASPVVLAPHGKQIKSGYIRSIRNLLKP